MAFDFKGFYICGLNKCTKLMLCEMHCTLLMQSLVHEKLYCCKVLLIQGFINVKVYVNTKAIVSFKIRQFKACSLSDGLEQTYLHLGCPPKNEKTRAPPPRISDDFSSLQIAVTSHPL